MNHKTYETIIFDLFGTLVDTFPARTFVRFLGELAAVLDVPEEEFIQLWKSKEFWQKRARGDFSTLEETFSYICQHFNRPVEDDRIAQAREMRYEYTRKSLLPRHDTVETLTILKQAGYKLGLISDCTIEVPHMWEQTPLAALIDVPIFSCVVHLKKPDPRIFLLACEQLGSEPEQCLYVGDGGSRELTGATEIGMEAILIKVPYEEHEPHEEQDWAGPKITSVKALLPLVDERFAEDE